MPMQNRLQPLAKAFARRFIEFLPTARYPIRSGVHSSTAFALTIAMDYAQSSNDVISCEDNLTKNSTSVMVDPSSSEPVDTTPLFNSSNDACYDPSSFQPSSGSSRTSGRNNFAVGISMRISLRT